MARLPEIRKRIKGVQNIRQITNAMKMIAAARLRRAEDAALALRPYSSHLERLCGRFLQDIIGTEHRYFESREVQRCLIVAISSDRGLCGPYNNNLVQACAEAIEARAPARPVLHAIGKRGALGLSRLGHKVDKQYTDVLDPVSFAEVESMTNDFEKLFLRGEVDEVLLVYTEFFSPMRQKLRTKVLLPCEPERMREQLANDYQRELPAGVAQEPQEFEKEELSIYEPDLETIMTTLFHRNLSVQLYRALLEAQASEHGARMVSMDNATDNADEMIEDLTLKLNRQRQESITREILDVMGGAEHLR